MVVSVFQVFAMPMVCPKMYLIAAALSLQVSDIPSVNPTPATGTTVQWFSQSNSKEHNG